MKDRENRCIKNKILLDMPIFQTVQESRLLVKTLSRISQWIGDKYFYYTITTIYGIYGDTMYIFKMKIGLNLLYIKRIRDLNS